MDLEQSFEYYMQEVNRKFEGWDFSYIQNRFIESPKSLSYNSMIIPYVIQASTMLDMGTGGGEFLSRLPLPKQTYATEFYPPNIPIAQARLEPIGVIVIPLTDENILPLNDNKFDLIINRHENYNPKEVLRILRLGGRFITQQVGWNDCIELNDWLDAPLPDDYDNTFTVERLVADLEEVGFTVEFHKSEALPTRVYDIGALVYYLKAIPWQIPDFSVAKYRDQLFSLHEEMVSNGFIELTSHRYLINAIKPKT